MRLFRTGAGKGEVLGAATIEFYASRARTIDSCSVFWDSDPESAALLPAVAFDEWLPNLRSTVIETDSGRRELRGHDAQSYALRAFQLWLERNDDRITDGEPPLTFSAVPIGDAGPRPVAQADVTMRVSVAKARVWSESEAKPREGRGVVFHAAHKILWDWVLTCGPAAVAPAEIVRRLRSQCDHYEEEGIPSSFMLREIGSAPFAAWRDSRQIPLA